MVKQNLKRENKNRIKSNKGVSKKNFSLSIPAWLPFAVIFVSAIILYYQTFDFLVVNCDDHEIILKNPDRISHIEDWRSEFSNSYMGNSYYRPIVNLSFIFDFTFAGKNMAQYHITNFIIFVINASLVFFLLSLLGYKRILSLLGGMIYVVHPVFTNSVAWIAGRNDLIYSFFILLSLIFLILFTNKNKWLYLTLHFLTFLLALFSKETAVVAPFLFIAYMFLIKKIKITEKRSIFLAITWIVSYGIWFSLRSMTELGTPVYETGIFVFLKNWATIPEFISKFFLPVNLSVLPTFGLFNTISGLGILGILIYLYTKKQVKRNGYLLFGLIWFLVIIIPGMFITLLNSHIWNEYLECRAYLAMFGLVIILFELTSAYFEANEKRYFAISIIVLGILSILTYTESKNYKDPTSFYESAIADDSERASFHYLLGQIYNNEFLLTNKAIYAKNASVEFEKAIELRPNYPLYYHSLGAAYMNGYDYNSAIKILNKAVKMGYKNQELFLSMVDLYFNSYKTDNALEIAKKSYAIFPSQKNQFELYSLYIKWASEFLQQKQYDLGAGIFKEAAILAPQEYKAFENLMNYYLMTKENLDSAAFYAKILLERGRKIDSAKLKILSPYLNKK